MKPEALGVFAWLGCRSERPRLAKCGRQVTMAEVARVSSVMRLPFLLLIFLAGCSLYDEMTVCTTKGCPGGHGLWVQVTPTVTNSIRVEVIPLGPNQYRTYTHTCTGAQCDQMIFFEGLIAERATVRVTTDTGVRETEVRPAYSRTFPNGPNCPVCMAAVVSVPSS